METKKVNNKMAINPKIITWGRERLNLSKKDLKKEFHNSDLWESGKDLPDYNELKKLSDFLDITTAIFFFPKPPENKLEWYFSDFNDDFKIHQLHLLNHNHIKNVMKGDDIIHNMSCMCIDDFIGFELKKENLYQTSSNVFKILRKKEKTFFSINNFINSIEKILGVFIFIKNMNDVISINLFDNQHPIIYITNNKKLFKENNNIFYDIFIELLYCLGNLYQGKSNIKIKNKKYYCEELTKKFVNEIINNMSCYNIFFKDMEKNYFNKKENVISQRYKQNCDNYEEENSSKEDYYDF